MKPRLQFTVRRLMALVAVVALAMPIAQRAAWLYRNPVRFVSYRVGKSSGRDAVLLSVDGGYDYSRRQPVPWGLPYWFTAEIAVIDAATGVAAGSRREHRFWISDASAQVKGDVPYDLTGLPPGRYFLRCRFRVIDALGRRTVVTCNGVCMPFDMP